MVTQVTSQASYKNNEGTIALASNGTTVTWTPTAAGSAITIAVERISSLKATGAASANCMVKIFETTLDGGEQIYKLTFTSPTNARAELAEFVKALSSIIQELKAPGSAAAAGATPATDSATTTLPGTPAAAATTASAAPKLNVWSDAQLVADGQLQQDLLKADAELASTFLETVLNGSVSAKQFWLGKVNRLRAFAISKNQSKGAYNVLSTMKPKTIDNAVRISLSREQIQDIFRQHPLVKTIYDENVPRISEGDFWKRFFGSRMFKKLKGEKILPQDPFDDIVDKYLNTEDESSHRKQKLDHVPNFINLAGNEQHASQAKGNRPDMTMRAERIENVPLIRTLNNLSMKIIDSVAPVDAELTGDRAVQELTLSDLQDNSEVDRIILNIQDQRRFFQSKDNQNSSNAEPKPAIDPAKATKRILKALTQSTAIDLAASSNDFTQNHDQHNPSSRTPAETATAQIAQAITDRHNHLHGQATSLTSTAVTGTVLIGSDEPNEMGLPPAIWDSIKLLHVTTFEFLRHFWNAFLSGDEKRANELSGHVKSLQRCLERYEAVAKDADVERDAERERKKAAALAEYKATGKKRRRTEEDNVGGGADVVRTYTSSTTRTVKKALKEYEKALREAEAEIAASGAAA